MDYFPCQVSHIRMVQLISHDSKLVFPHNATLLDPLSRRTIFGLAGLLVDHYSPSLLVGHHRKHETKGSLKILIDRGRSNVQVPKPNSPSRDESSKTESNTKVRT